MFGPAPLPFPAQLRERQLNALEETKMRRPKRWVRQVVLLSGLILTAAGCGGKGSLSKVRGVVTLDGVPLQGATVSFMPVEGKGRVASGQSGSDGSFELTTFRTDDGAYSGDYRVVVVVEEPNHIDPRTLTDEQKKEARIGTMTPQGKKKQAEKKSKRPPQIPEIYSDVKKTPLREVVPTDGKIELALKSKI
jgi:hypothetical protein